MPEYGDFFSLPPEHVGPRGPYGPKGPSGMRDDLLISMGRERHDDHDELCSAYGKPYRSVTFDGTSFPCDCDLIMAVQQRECDRIVAGIEALSPENVYSYNGEVILRSDAARIARNGGSNG